MVLLTSVRPKPAFGPFVVRLWVKFSKFWPGETSDLYANSRESFPPGFFNYFGSPTAKNYDSVFLIVVRPNASFDQRATKTRIRSFRPSCDHFPILVLLTNGATNGGLMPKKPPLSPRWPSAPTSNRCWGVRLASFFFPSIRVFYSISVSTVNGAKCSNITERFPNEICSRNYPNWNSQQIYNFHFGWSFRRH